MKNILNEKGKLVGRELNNGQLLDGKGHLVARFVDGSNLTVDGKGKNVGRGDQKLRQLSK